MRKAVFIAQIEFGFETEAFVGRRALEHERMQQAGFPVIEQYGQGPWSSLLPITVENRLHLGDDPDRIHLSGLAAPVTDEPVPHVLLPQIGHVDE